MSFLYDYLSAIIVAVCSSVLLWLFGGTRGDFLTPVAPWLALFLLEALVFFPQRHEHETTYGARTRVWKELKRSPLALVVAALLIVLAVPFANTGLCPNCDARLIADGWRPEPKLPILPFCVDRLDHLNVCWWFLLATLTVLVVRHSLAARGQRFVVGAVVWNATLVAVFGFVEAVLGAPGPWWRTDHGSPWGVASQFFATFGYPNMAGSYFVLAFGLAVAMWRYRRGRIRSMEKARDISSTAPKRPRMFWKKNLYLIPVAVNFYAALSTLSRAAIILSVASAAIYCYHAFATMLSGYHRADKVRIGVVVAVAFAIVTSVAVHYLPAKIQKEVDTLTAVKVLDRVSGRGDRPKDLAFQLWKKHKIFGCGGWGYRHLSPALMDRESVKTIKYAIGGMNVHNDYLQFLAEHGLVGFGLIVALVVLLYFPVARVWRQRSRAAAFAKEGEKLPRPRQLFALPAPAFAITVACLCPLVHAFGDCPLRSPAVLVGFFLALAAIPGFLPEGSVAPSSGRGVSPRHTEEEHRHHHRHHRHIHRH